MSPTFRVVAVLCAVALSVLLVNAWPGTETGDVARQASPALPPATEVLGQSGGALGMVGRALSVPTGQPAAGRPALRATHPDENPHTPPPPVSSASYVNAIIMDAPAYLGDVALPWRYTLSTAVADGVDEGTVHHAIAAWDDVPGSRWASHFAGYTTRNRAVADGVSLVFMESSCEGVTNANAYVYTDGGIGVRRYGANGTQLLEADIGVCPRVSGTAQLERAIRHEVGHVVGLAHHCDPGDPCWTEEMGPGGLSCRVMFWQARGCQEGLSEGERAALRALYPTLRPLDGPSRVETAARASFVSAADREAEVVVVVDADAPTGVAPAAAALAGRLDGTFLLARPDADSCLAGTARDELNRVLRHRRPLVLVGEWPESCRWLAFDWQLSLRRVPAEDPVAAAIELAELGGPAEAVVVAGMAADGLTAGGDAIPAAALAGRMGAPLVLTTRDDPSPETVDWIHSAAPTSVAVVGGPAAVPTGLDAALGTEGVPVERLAGGDRVATALAVAHRTQGLGGAAVVLAAATADADGLSAAVVATHRAGVLVLTGPTADPRVEDYLRGWRPTEGWAVGGPAVLPQEVRDAYAVLIG